MKKTIYIAAALLLTLAAGCQKETLDESVKGKTVRYTFCGETTAPTKISIGEKTGDKWPVLWSAGDKLGIISTKSETFANKYANLIQESAGKTSGVFILEDEVEVTEDTPVVLYYPYSELTTQSENKISSYVPVEQKQSKPNDSGNLSKYAFAYDTQTIKAAGEDGIQPPVSFALNHGTAYLKLVISSSEYSSLKLMGASIYSEDATFTGDISIDLATGEPTIENGKSCAVVTVENPETLSSAQELYLAVLPQNLSGKDVYVSVSMSDGKKNVTIPRKIAVGEILANAVNTIRIENVAASDNTFPWYQIEETRYLAEGYAYGPSNMYMVTHSKETAAEFTVDLKARGYFVGCEEPAYLKIIYAHNLNDKNYPIQINGKRNNPTSTEDYEEYVPLNAGYTAVIKASHSGGYTGYVSKIGVCNADKEYIWAFHVWTLDSNDAIQEQQFTCGATVMDRQLGNSYLNYYELQGQDPKKYDKWHDCGLYYQWGRPTGYSWGSHTMPATDRTPSSVTEIKEGARTPDKFYYYDKDTNAGRDWYIGAHRGVHSDRKDDLWGNPNKSTGEGSPERGTKSVFDPCPQGWMVCSPDVLKEVYSGKNGEFEISGNRYYVIYNIGTVETSWGFNSFKWGGTAGNADQYKSFGYWSNSPVGNAESTSVYACALIWHKEAWGQEAARADALSVRCMKDVDNR